MPARVAEGVVVRAGTLWDARFPLTEFFYDLRRNQFDVRKYGVERDGGKKPR
jgi:hypothetical protein